MTEVEAALQILGLSFEIGGVLLMANGYTRAVADRGTLRLLLRALRGRDPVVEEASKMLHLTRENKPAVLQGLAYLVLGFVIQLSGIVVGLLTA